MADTKRYVAQVVRMTMLWEPMRVFGPPAVFLGLFGVKLTFDLVDKDFRVATNTLVVLGVSLAIAVLGMLADLLVWISPLGHRYTKSGRPPPKEC